MIWIMENVADDARFDMTDWQNVIVKTDLSGQHYCGMTYCIGGFCATDKQFNAQGLVLEGCPVYRDDLGTLYCDGFEAMAGFFDIPFDDSFALFGVSAEYVRTVSQAVAMLKHYRETQTVIYPE